MKIVIGSDHAGFKLKEYIKEYLINHNFEVIDVGTNSTESVDYPIYGFKVGNEVIKNNCFGVACCGSGIGISIAANKIKGIRAVNCNNIDLAYLSRLHNNCNVICFGERLIGDYSNAITYLEKFLNTEFEGDRHIKRVDMLNKGDNYER